MKKIAAILLSVYFAFAGFPLTTPQQPVVAVQTASASNGRAAIIEWRYVVIDGRLYRNQYNHSTGEWVGEWELVE